MGGRERDEIKKAFGNGAAAWEANQEHLHNPLVLPDFWHIVEHSLSHALPGH